jgi:hypothetical protein
VNPTATYSGSLTVGQDCLAGGGMVIWYGLSEAVEPELGTVLYAFGSVEAVKTASGSIAAVLTAKGGVEAVKSATGSVQSVLNAAGSVEAVKTARGSL